MKTTAVGAAVFGLLGGMGLVLAWGQRAAGQAPPLSTRLADAVRHSWIQFQLSSGRVVLKPIRRLQTSTSSTIDSRRERLTVRTAGPDPAIDYELTTPDQQLSVRFTAANRLEIRRIPKGDSRIVPIEFQQPAAGPVWLKVGGSEPREHQAPSLWHLFLAEPALCREQLAPLLNYLRPDWDLPTTAEQIAALLVQSASGGSSPDHKRWAELVKQLGDDRFAKREAADRQLREAGRAVVAYLQQLDPSRLDAEQQFRIRRIILALTDTGADDTPEQVAAWLLYDPAAWLTLLCHQTEATRRAAARQLEVLLGNPIEFDPAADPQTRARQIDTLRARLSGK
ncbi:MAG: hypothetical protein ACUVUC_15285 [Thermoguttaceae bacterium]